MRKMRGEHTESARLATTTKGPRGTKINDEIQPSNLKSHHTFKQKTGLKPQRTFPVCGWRPPTVQLPLAKQMSRD